MPALSRDRWRDHRARLRTSACAGEPVLTEREIDVLATLATGALWREAAEQMHLSMNCLKTCAGQAHGALGARTLEGAIRRCEDMAILPAESGRRVV